MSIRAAFISLLLWTIASCDSAIAEEKSLPAGVRLVGDSPGIHNVFELGTNVYSGSTPVGEEGFSSLAKLGVKTIISVDGAKPEVELAKRHGIRYVHLPHGYDGINSERQLQLIKAGAILPRPLYIHCHHGEHRGPAAAALICMANEAWSSPEAEAWLHHAGTSTNYAGLYAAVRTFKRPTREQLEKVSGDFAAIARVSSLVGAMVDLDMRWEHLKSIQSSGYRTPLNHPDILPLNEIVLLREQYREAQRLPEASLKGTDFLERLRVAEKEAEAAEQLLRKAGIESNPGLRRRVDEAFSAIGESCSTCHKAYRNVPNGETGTLRQ